MAHSFNSPSIPPPPNVTPSSTLKAGSRHFRPKVPRPPVQNPFDKFSQGDFDSWIGKLTGDLERALGYEDLDQEQPDASSPAPDTRAVLDREDGYSDTESYVEDSFAEVKARRANKGKARDPREGPGLGPKYGDQDQPIEILSEDDADWHENSQMLGFDEEGEDEGGEYDEDEEGEYAEEGDPGEDVDNEEGGEAESSARVRQRWSQDGHRIIQGPPRDDVGDAELVDSEGEYEEEYEEDYNELEDEDTPAGGRDSAEKAVNLLSDDEPSPPVANRQRDEEEEFLSDDEPGDVRSSPARSNEDTGVQEDQDDHMQPSDEDTAFPPHSATKGELANVLVEIQDPWAPVAKYAEDYYAGGEIRRLPGGQSSAHHLGVTDDARGFLSPGVVNNAELEGGEDARQDDEIEDDYDHIVEDETRETESEDLDEHDHLFNRLRSSYAMSYSRGQPEHMGLSVKSGTGTNEEPFMIESDDEEGKPVPMTPVPQLESTELKEEERDEYGDSEDGIEYAEERKEKGSALGVNATVEDFTPELQADAVEDSRENGDFLGEFQEAQHGAEPYSDEEIQPTTFISNHQTSQAAQQPISLPSLLPTPPAEPSEPVKAKVAADEAVENISLLYDSTTPSVISEIHNLQQETKTIPGPSGNIAGWNFDIPFPGVGFLTGPAPETSSGHLNIGNSTPGVFGATNASIDTRVFEFDDMTTPYALSASGNKHLVHTQMGRKMRGISEDGINPDVDEKEADEFEEPGVLPLMTSDLEHSENEEVEEDDSTGEVVQITGPMPYNGVLSEERAAPSELFGAMEEGIESGEATGVPIFVEEPEEYWSGTPPSEITIKIHAASPLPPSAIDSPEYLQDVKDEAAGYEEAVPVSALSASCHPGETITGESSTVGEAVVVDDNRKDPDISAQEIAGDSDLIESEPRVDDADVTITIEVEDIGSKPHEGLFDFGESSIYTVEEGLTESEYLQSKSTSRAASIGIVNMQVDEVMPPMVMIGDVEEPIYDDGLEHEVSGFRDAEDRMEAQIELAEIADVRNAQWTIQPSDVTCPEEISADTVLTETHIVAGPTLEISEADNYFDQPGTPPMDAADMDLTGQKNIFSSPSGGLPTIIQLPGTPQKVLSPGGTPGAGPTPVAIAVDPAVLKALKTNPALFSPPWLRPRQQSHEGSPSNVPENTAPVVSTTVEATGIQETVIDKSSPSLSNTPSTGDVEIAESSTTNSNISQISFPVTSVAAKLTLPTLFDDPYPYSLSTPGPQNEEEGSDEEESTEQENSISSSSSFDKSPSSAMNNAILSSTVDMKLQYPSGKTSEPVELAVIPQAEVDDIVDKALEAEKGLVDAEAEAHKLINEFLVDEPESDTDADGEADPEFTGLKTSVKEQSNETDIQEVGGLSPSIAVDVVVGEIEASSAKADSLKEETPGEDHAEMTASAMAHDVALQDDEQDPLKLMGNDSIAAPGEALDPTPPQKMGAGEDEHESESEDEVVAATIPQSRQSPGHKPSKGTPSTTLLELPTPPQPEGLRDPSSHTLLFPHTSQPPEIGSSNGHVPHDLAAAAYMLAPSASLPALGTDRSNKDIIPLRSSISPARSFRRTEDELPISLTGDHTDTGVPRSVTQVSAEKISGEPSPTGPESQIEAPTRKVHISVEDPYHADNDSDQDEGVRASGAKKRKRSHSDISNTELPFTPAQSSSTTKGNRKVTGSRATVKASRVSKDGKKHDQQPPQPPSKRALFPIKTTTSRSPSVTSSILSDYSFPTQSSPTRHLLSSEPRPFLHAHSRRKQGKTPTTMQEQLQKQRRPSLPSASGSLTGIMRAEDVLTKAPPASSNSSSLVTRSHCRYHKISIPKTENGPRINFLVPGCSLNDEDLIKEEEIEDHGEAVIQGDTLIVDDIETLNFEAYLQWVMRQLVGPEILREHEVFYLPEPDEEIIRNPHRPQKRKGGKPEKKRPKLADDTTVGSPRSPIVGQSPSQGSSIGSSASVLQKLLGSENEDLSTVTETEDEKFSLLKTQSKPDQMEQGVAIDLNGSTTKGDKGLVPSRKRGRRLGQDAAAYNPSNDSDELSLTDSSDYNTTRRGTRGKGQKRTRTSELNVTDGMDGRKPKKPRTRPNQLDRERSASHSS